MSFGHVQEENVFESLTCGNMMNSDRGGILPSENTKSCSAVVSLTKYCPGSIVEPYAASVTLSGCFLSCD